MKLKILAVILGTVVMTNPVWTQDALGIDMAQMIKTVTLDSFEPESVALTGASSWAKLDASWPVNPSPKDTSYLKVTIPPGTTVLKYSKALPMEGMPKVLSFWANGGKGSLKWEVSVIDRLGLEYFLTLGSSDQFWRELKMSIPPLATFPIKVSGYRITNSGATPVEVSMNLLTMITDTFGDRRDPDEIPGGW